MLQPSTHIPMGGKRFPPCFSPVWNCLAPDKLVFPAVKQQLTRCSFRHTENPESSVDDVLQPMPRLERAHRQTFQIFKQADLYQQGNQAERQAYPFYNVPCAEKKLSKIQSLPFGKERHSESAFIHSVSLGTLNKQVSMFQSLFQVHVTKQTKMHSK